MKRNSTTGSETTLLFDVWLVTHLTTRLLDDVLRPLGLTGDEFGLCSLIYSFGPISPTQISRVTGMAPTTISGMLRRLAARGHITDVPHPDDARSRLLRLSDGGLRVTADAAKSLMATLSRLHDRLDAEPATIRGSLRDLDAGLRQLVDVAPRPYDGPQRGPTTEQAAVSYRGARLSPAQTDEVRAFIDWIRARDQTAQQPDAIDREP